MAFYLEEIGIQEDEKEDFKDIFYEFPSYERPLVVEYIKKLQSDNLSHSSILSKLDKTSILSTPDQRFIIEKLQSLINCNLTKFEQYNLLELLSPTPKVAYQHKYLEEFFDIVKPLIKQTMTSEDLLAIIEAVSSIPIDERQNLLKDVQPLIKDTMKGEDIAYLIKMARTLSYKERQALTSILQPLVKDTMTGKEVGRLLRKLQ